MLNDDPPEIAKNSEKTGDPQHPKESNTEFRVEDLRFRTSQGELSTPSKICHCGVSYCKYVGAVRGYAYNASKLLHCKIMIAEPLPFESKGYMKLNQSRDLIQRDWEMLDLRS